MCPDRVWDRTRTAVMTMILVASIAGLGVQARPGPRLEAATEKEGLLDRVDRLEKELGRRKIAYLESSRPFKIEDGWTSPAIGVESSKGDVVRVTIGFDAQTVSCAWYWSVQSAKKAIIQRLVFHDHSPRTSPECPGGWFSQFDQAIYPVGDEPGGTFWVKMNNFPKAGDYTIHRLRVIVENLGKAEVTRVTLPESK